MSDIMAILRGKKERKEEKEKTIYTPLHRFLSVLVEQLGDWSRKS